MRCNSEVGREVQRQLNVAMDFELPIEDRVRAAERLGDLGDTTVAIPLGVLLGQTDSELRAALNETLKRLSATQAIIRDLQSPIPPKRIRATQVLALIADDAAVPSLIEALADPCAKVRESAASALYSFRSAAAIPMLAKALASDPDADVRGAAAQALGEIPSFEAVNVLERAKATEADGFTRILIERSILRWRAQSSVADLRL
jgi:HEAT repeat protein